MYFYEKVSLFIIKYFNKGYITSREKAAMLRELYLSSICNDAIYFTINSDNRNILFTCDELVDPLKPFYFDYVARLSVYTPQGDPDFTIYYNSDTDKFWIDEPTKYKGDYNEN